MKDERRSRFFLTAGSIVVVVAVFSWEAVRAQAIYAGITPFPLGDYWELVINALLRDVVILTLGGLLFFRRKRIPTGYAVISPLSCWGRFIWVLPAL